MSYFNAAFLLVVGAEGGYVDDPNDPGGETKYGISKREYPSLNISALTIDDAKAIYLRDYWAPLGLDAKPWGTSLLKFDASVNQGLSYARTLPDDPTDICVARALRYASNSHLPTYGRGWFNRLFKMFRHSLESPV
jgi:lysozyme family protein